MASVLSLPGSNGNAATSPDSAAVSVVGDIDLRCELAASDWDGANQVIQAKEETGDISWRWQLLLTTGVQQLAISVNGTNLVFVATSTTAIDALVADGKGVQLRVTRAEATGHTAYYYRTDLTKDLSDDTGWTFDGNAFGTSGAIFDSGSPVQIGAINAVLGFAMTGNIYRSQVYDGINGTLVFDADPTAEAPGTTSFTESSAQAATVTIHQSGSPQAEIITDPALIILRRRMEGI